VALIGLAEHWVKEEIFWPAVFAKEYIHVL
jgi:hypothetical protein